MFYRRRWRVVKGLHKFAFILLVFGGLNWLFIGIWDWNLVSSWLSSVETWVYILIGLAAVYEIVTHGGSCKYCMKK